ncbi:DUF2914 domain-containing protein [bacterium]|jgi:hypothetical protein|nr:DUF2914 domain-containing protein [bacterium]MBT4292583.1 DUF2914 domain-containing protein [bacterium]MBT7310561.1 DUF2914 domain-containing protein [bacterium]
MRQLILLITLLVALLVPIFSSALAAEQELSVPELVIGVEVNKKDRSIDGAGTDFASDVGKLVCFTRVFGAEKQTQIYHVWYHEGRTIAKIPLQVKSRSWRTWSTKKILPGWTGDWVVKVLDSDGLVIASQKFKITDVADASLKQEKE